MQDTKETAQNKKRYDAPVLTEYGEVSKLTEAGGRSSTDDHGGNHMYPAA